MHPLIDHGKCTLRVGLSEFFRPFSLPFFFWGYGLRSPDPSTRIFFDLRVLDSKLLLSTFDDIVNLSSVCVGVTLDTYVDPK